MKRFNENNLRLQYEVKYKLLEAETLSKIEAMETQIQRLEEASDL
jgi:hypothetical protein